MNVEDMGRNSIQLYELRGLRLDHQDIIDKFKQFSDHEWPIKLRGDKPDAKRYSRFQFNSVKTDENDNDVLCYNVNVKRDTLDSENPEIFHHSICFTKNPYFFIAGMQSKNTLLSYLKHLLHDGRDEFQPKFLFKDAMKKFTDEIITEDGKNRMYRPRFHFSEKYNNREFNDFAIDEIKCATKDNEYDKMLKHCYYFDPTFKINNMFVKIYPNSMQRKQDTEIKLKLNHEGRIYSSSLPVTSVLNNLIMYF